VTALDLLRDAPESVRRERGYRHTLDEILQQPSTWLETATLARESGIAIAAEGPVVLTGSGSSHYIGESLEPILARALGTTVRAVPAGTILTDGESYVPKSTRGTLVSFARSGDSPESSAAVDWFLENRPGFRHVILSCNRAGALATRYRGREQVSLIVLPERTNDRSLVMTSSFTNLWLAGRLAGGGEPDVPALSAAAKSIFTDFADLISEIGSARFDEAIFLGTGPRFGAAREGALKMLEMSDGRTPTFAETFLGLRHGPMCAARESTLLVGLLSADEPARSYERDLLAELSSKGLGARTLLIGAEGHVRFAIEDDDSAILGVVVAQLLGLFRSLGLGLRPDAPSPAGVITRVVPGFEIH
jgi:tagatose-6-phosphate ketose/aldose isomerase